MVQSQNTLSAEWLKSGRNLDFCLLAFCSCLLTLLCHQAPAHVSAGSTARSPFPTTLNIDFAIKAGLFTSSKSDDQEQAPEL
jgi:hypothetical protein